MSRAQGRHFGYFPRTKGDLQLCSHVSRCREPALPDSPYCDRHHARTEKLSALHSSGQGFKRWQR